jgi:hypothetical protein
MTTLGRVIFVEAKGENHGKWLLLNFYGTLLATVFLEDPGYAGAIRALSRMREECEARWAGSRLYSRSAVEYLVIK